MNDKARSLGVVGGLLVVAALLTIPLWLPVLTNPPTTAPAPISNSPFMPQASAQGLGKAPQGKVPPLLGLIPLTDEFMVSRHLRLEIPMGANSGKLQALVQGTQPVELEGLGPLEYWELDPADVERFVPTRVGMWFDCYSSTLRFLSQLEDYELWHDTICNSWYLVGMLPMPSQEEEVLPLPEDMEDMPAVPPSSDDLIEPAIWLATQHEFLVDLVDPDNSLTINEPPQLPDSFVGTYEYVEGLVQDAAAATLREGEAFPTYELNVRFGDFGPGEVTSTMVLGSWMRDEFAMERLLLLLDESGAELMRLQGRPLEPYAAQTLLFDFLVDADHDGDDEAVVLARSRDGASRLMLWSFGNGTLEVLGEGTWWGCSQGVPGAESMEFVYGRST